MTLLKKISIRRFCAVALLVVAGVLLSVNSTAVNAVGALPKAPPAGSSFDQRLAFYKKEYDPKLSKDDQQHLQSECINTQSKLRTISGQAKTKLANYNDTYRKIDGIVLVNIGRLKLANQSVFNLAQQEAAFEQETATFKSLTDSYTQALDDSLVINCQSDTVGFQALIDADRAYYDAISSQSTVIYNLTTNKIKTTLEGYFN